MTPLAFAAQECSNYQPDGSCLGVGIRDDGGLYSFGAKPRCVLAAGQQCRFFEECVLPIGIAPDCAANVVRMKARDRAIRLYSPEAKRLKKLKGFICPQCRSREMEDGERLCYVCREKRNLAKKERRRQNGTSESQNPQKSAL